MSISLTCLCGNVISATADQAGQQIACFSCGYLNLIPTAGDASELLAAPTEIPTDEILVLELADLEEVPVVVPLAETEEEIPEIEVEELVPPWDEKQQVIVPKERHQTRAKQSDGSVKKKQLSDFERNAAAAGQNSWATIGEIRLVEPAECIAYGPGGAVALAGQDDEVLVLNMRKGNKLDRFGGHDDIVTSVAISAIGDCAVSGDELGDLFYWNVVKCKRLRRLRGHDSPISALAISPDGNHAASGDHEGVLRLWKLSSNQDRDLAHSEWSARISSLAFSADSNLLLASSERGQVSLWSVKTGACLQQFKHPTESIISAQFGARRGILFAAAKPIQSKTPVHPTVWRMDADSKSAQECFLPAEQASIIPHAVALDQGAKRLLIAGRSIVDTGVGSDCLQVWNLAQSRLLYAFHDVKHSAAYLAITPGGTRVLVALTNAWLQVFALPQADSDPPFPSPHNGEERLRRVE